VQTPAAVPVAEVTAGRVFVAVDAQKPNDVDECAAIAAFHDRGVIVSVDPRSANDPLHDCVTVAPFNPRTTCHEVVVAFPVLLTLTFAQ
jgi:hypothetical protein